MLVKIDTKQLQKLQLEDCELTDMIQKDKIRVSSNMQLKLIELPYEQINIWSETSTGVCRPYIPKELRRTVFDNLHNISHPGIRASRKLVTSKYFWPGMNIDIGQWAKTCISCQKSKIFRHTKSPLGTFKAPQGRFDHIHIDIVGPLPPSNGYRYILTAIDRFTRWPEAYPMPDMLATTVAKTFYNNFISRFGSPVTITTDQGSQFESKLFNELMHFLGTHKIHTTPYHPQANGMVEVLHRRLKESLKARGNVLHWSDELPTILLGMRIAYKEELKCCPAELVYGQTIRTPGEFFIPNTNTTVVDPENYVEQLKQSMRILTPVVPNHHFRNSYIQKSLDTCDYVFVRIDKVRTGLMQPYDGPFRVIRKLRKQFILDIKGKNSTISIDRLKPAFVDKNSEMSKGSNTKTVSFNI